MKQPLVKRVLTCGYRPFEHTAAEQITPNEQRIAQQIKDLNAKGLTLQQIADAVGTNCNTCIMPGTVNLYLQYVANRGVMNRAH